MSRCVCGSTAPGRTNFPDASITRSASTSNDAPMREICSPSTSTSAWTSSVAVTTRPPLMRTDIRSLPFCLPLLAALRHLDVGRLPVLALDVDALFLELAHRRLGVLARVDAVVGLALDHVVVGRDLDGRVVVGLVHDADAGLVRPDQLV